MGQCIKCGRETANSYVFYSADYHSQGNSYRMGSMEHTTIRYTNVNKHSEFVCPKCIGVGGIEWYVFAGIFYLFTVFLIVFPFVAPEKGITPAWIWLTIGSFIFSSLVLFLGLIATRAHNKNVKEDKGVKEDVGSYFLVYRVKSRNPKKTYFTTEQYKNLR